MNLIPIDAGSSAPDAAAGATPVDGDFAALITGLMSGDTQIVPLLDIPSSRPGLDGLASVGGSEPTDIAGSILEFIGAPPAEGPPTSHGPVPASAHPIKSVEADQADGEVVIHPVAHESTVTAGAVDVVVDPLAEDDLATVHPIANHLARPTTDASAGAVAPGTPTQDPAPFAAPSPSPPTSPSSTKSPSPTPIETQTSAPIEVTPESVAGREASMVGDASLTRLEPTSPDALSDEATTGAAQRVAAPPTPKRPLRAQVPPIGPRGPGPSSPTSNNTIEAPTLLSHTEASKPVDSTFQPPAEPQVVHSDVELGSGPSIRPSETGRPSGSIPQPAMVGIARRVEEAIAALATKPDPRIVTLQLDELDGLRLTVALRPDGLHISSNGDAGLTGEIERALASRGFDLASDGDRNREGADQGPDDGWRPPPGDRPRATNPRGIRL